MTRRPDKNAEYGNRTEMEDLSRIKYELQRFFIGGAFDLYENERFVASLEPECAAAEISYGKLVLAFWGDGWSRSWRIVACEANPENLRLHCTKQMGRVQAVLLLRRGQAESNKAQSRTEFAGKIAALIEANLARFQVEQIIQARDTWRHLSKVRTRLIMKERGNTIAAVAVSACESQDDIDAALGEGLIWLEELRSRGRKVRRLALFVPAGKAATISCRLTCMTLAGTTISLYEVDEAANHIKPVAAFAQADLADNLKRAAERAEWAKPGAVSAETTRLIDGAKQLAGDILETQQRNGWVYLSIRGLTFARVSMQKAIVEFGLQRPRKKLASASHNEFEELLSHINRVRQPLAENRDDPVFRAQAEGWLESVIRKDVSAIDPTLDPRFVYSQVPAYRGEQRKFIDLLTATRSGRLVVMELKVSEDAELPFQGLDYWQRIDWHRRRGDFERRGYFKGMILSDEAPLIYLVAPLFRFHATTKFIAARIARQVPVYRIGINEDWRTQLQVLLSERLN